MKFSGQCPVCGAALHLARLSCPGCKAEFPTDEPLSPYECLAPEYARFLQTFLACRGSMKDVQNKLGISYPTAKKNLDELLLQLNLRGEEESLEVGRALHAAKAQARASAQGKGFSRRKKQAIPGPDFSKLDKELKLEDFVRRYTAKRVEPIPVNQGMVEAAFQQLRKTTDAQRRVDCRSCGYPSCLDMATAVAKNLNHVENCVEYFKSVIDEQREVRSDAPISYSMRSRASCVTG